VPITETLAKCSTNLLAKVPFPELLPPANSIRKGFFFVMICIFVQYFNLNFNKLKKEAFLDTGVPAEISQLLNDASLNSIEDPAEYSHQVFQQMLAQINEKMKKMY